MLISSEHCPHASFCHSYQYAHWQTFAVRVRGSCWLIACQPCFMQTAVQCTRPLCMWSHVRSMPFYVINVYGYEHISRVFPVTACRLTLPVVSFGVSSHSFSMEQSRRNALKENEGTISPAKMRVHPARKLRFPETDSCLAYMFCMCTACVKCCFGHCAVLLVGRKFATPATYKRSTL